MDEHNMNGHIQRSNGGHGKPRGLMANQDTWSALSPELIGESIRNAARQRIRIICNSVVMCRRNCELARLYWLCDKEVR